MLDVELLLFTLLDRDAPEEAKVAAEVDVDTMDHLPFVTFSATGPGQTGNGRGIWPTVLTLNVFAEGLDAARTYAMRMYDMVHNWPPQNGLVDELGWVNDVEDSDLFSRVGSATVDGRNITQYAGSFDLVLRN